MADLGSGPHTPSSFSGSTPLGKHLVVTLAFVTATVLGEGCLCSFTFLSCSIEVALNLLEKQFAAHYDLFHVVKTINARCYK